MFRALFSISWRTCYNVGVLRLSGGTGVTRTVAVDLHNRVRNLQIKKYTWKTYNVYGDTVS